MKELADIGALRVFVAVAETGSFSEGARRVGLTRSAAGKAIARLEDLLDARLLHRTTRSVRLTSDGSAFHERAVQILNDLEEAQDAIRLVRATPRGVLRITTTEAFGRLMVLPVLAEYLDRWPELTADVSFSDHIVNVAEEGLDLAIRIGHWTASPELISRVVARSCGQLCASPQYLARWGTPQTPDELTNHRLLMFGAGRQVSPWLAEVAGNTAPLPQLRPTMLCDNASALLAAAISGMGIACLPQFLLERSVQEGALQIVLPTHTTPALPISVVYPSRRHLSPRVRLFIELLASRLSTMLC